MPSKFQYGVSDDYSRANFGHITSATRLLFLTVEFRLLTIIPRMLTVVTLLMLPSDDGAPTYGPGLVNAGRRGLF